MANQYYVVGKTFEDDKEVTYSHPCLTKSAAVSKKLDLMADGRNRVHIVAAKDMLWCDKCKRLIEPVDGESGGSAVCLCPNCGNECCFDDNDE